MTKHDEIFKDLTIKELLGRIERGDDSSNQEFVTILDGMGLKIDREAAENGATHFQPNWINYFNEKSKRMISLPDLYLAGKYGDEALLKSLRDDFRDSKVITSTRFELAKTHIWCFHNYQSKYEKTKEIKLDVPVYFIGSRDSLDDFLSKEHTLYKEQTDEEFRMLFLQGLFDIKDDRKAIVQTLERLSSYPAKKIRISTPNNLERSMRKEMMGVMYYTTYSFNIDLEYLGFIGRSRGVSLK